MAANTPDLPHNEGDTFTNDETGIKYQFINGAWRAVSSKAAEDVADAIGSIDLQKVTENGNSTDQGIEIKNSRLKTYGEVYFQSNGDTPVTLDSGSSYKPMVHLKSFSNTTTTEEGETDTFARKDVLKINARGEAELFGHLKAEPGENTNQVIVYEQYKELQDSIVSLQQEIEKLSLVLDEGGDYRLLSTPENPADYVRDGIVYFGNTAGNPITNPSSWDEVGSIFIDEKDRNGNTHDFGPNVVQPGDLIELIGDNSFALFEVKGTGQYEEGLGKRFAVWATTTIKATGVPGPQDTEYKIKSFRLGSLDVAETDARYVNLTGDEMTGGLEIKPASANAALDVYQGNGQTDSASIFRVFDKANQTCLYINGAGNLGAKQGWSPSMGNHLTTKDYVDLTDAQLRDYINGELDDYVKKAGDTMSGTLETTDKIWIRPNAEGANGANNMLVVNQHGAASGSIARFQQNGVDVVKIEHGKTTSFENNRIVKVANPTNDTDATNKKWVEDLVNTKMADLTLGAHTPAHFSWKRENKESGSPAVGCWYIKAPFLYMSSTTQEGVRLNSTSLLDDKGANMWNNEKAQCSMWKKSGDQYVIVQTFEAQKYRTSYSGGGGTTSTTIFQLEVAHPKIEWSKISYNEVHWISIPGLVC